MRPAGDQKINRRWFQAIPKSFFGTIEPRRGIPRNNALFTGALALAGAFTMSYQFGAERLMVRGY
ncbi:MAG: hypothetical protein HUU41_12930 [Bryobacteraceae bacterium]|nr:hypothetical protein [Bryobacteraceae bacterium]